MSRALILTLVFGLFLCVDARAEKSVHLEFPSPDTRWQVVADWNELHEGYTFHLLDPRSGKVYFDVPQNPNDLWPHRLYAFWSPDGKYVAISVYYGAIAREVDVYRISGNRPRDISLLPKNSTQYDDFCMCSAPWKNYTDLIVYA